MMTRLRSESCPHHRDIASYGGVEDVANVRIVRAKMDAIKAHIRLDKLAIICTNPAREFQYEGPLLRIAIDYALEVRRPCE